MSYESEHLIIGALVKKPDLINEIELMPDDFEFDSYQKIYSAIIDMTSTGEVIDVISLSEYMDKTCAGNSWLSVVGKAAVDCFTMANIGWHCENVKNDSRVAKAKSIAVELLNNIESKLDSSDLIDESVKKLMDLSVTRRSYECTLSQALKSSIEIIEAAAECDGTVGVPSGLKDLDDILSGFHNSDLYIVAARPSIGKTAVLLNFLDNSGVSAGLISSEQPSEQIGVRMIAISGRVNSHRMRTGSLQDIDYQKISMAVTKMHNAGNIWINDRSGITILEVIRQARKWKYSHDIKILYVDYVQRIKWTNQNMARWEQVGNVVIALKELARELNIPVVALAQVNREVEKRNDKRPTMGDIANSSEIEKEADCIMTLYRDEVYNQDTKDVGIMEIDVLKNRHGPTGYKRFTWNEKYMRVDNYCAQAYSDS